MSDSTTGKQQGGARWKTHLFIFPLGGGYFFKLLILDTVGVPLFIHPKALHWPQESPRLVAFNSYRS